MFWKKKKNKDKSETWGKAARTGKWRSTKSLIAKLDKTMSLYIRLRDVNKDGYFRCPTCGRYLPFAKGDCSHLWGRAHMSTRFDPDNMVMECAYDNRMNSSHLLELSRFFEKKLGTQRYELLRVKHNQTKKWSNWELEQLIEYYSKETERLKKKRITKTGKIKYKMKTNQIMKRPLANFTVEQRTKDGMFCATALLKQWNEQDGVVQRKLDNYFASSKTAEFIDTIVKRENLDTPKMVYVKSRASRGNGAGTWMHPLLFIDFAMWINPSFKYDVLKFVYDKMLVYRNEAGEAYKQLASAVKKIVTPSEMQKYMQTIAKGINFIIVGKHQHLMRNECGTEEKQREFFEIERQIAMLIEDGFLKSGDDVVEYLRRKFQKKFF